MPSKRRKSCRHARRPIGGLQLETLEARLLLATLLPGDANRDLHFDQADLVQALKSGKLNQQIPAVWDEGDWDGAPGGSELNPPEGDGFFNDQDIELTFQFDHYRTGAYDPAAGNPIDDLQPLVAGGQEGDAFISVIYDANTGETQVDVPSSAFLSAIDIESKSGIFTGQSVAFLNGPFDVDTDHELVYLPIGTEFGSISFGRVAPAGLQEAFLLDDLLVDGARFDGGDLGRVDLIYLGDGQQDPLTISPIQDVSIDENTTATGFFLIEPLTDGITTSVESAKPDLIPPENVVITGPLPGGLFRFDATPLPDQTGIVSITLRAMNESGGSDVRRFSILVNEVPEDPTISDIADIVIEENTTAMGSFTAGPDPTNLTISANSSNTALLPNDGIQISGPDPDGTFTFNLVPRQGQSGESIVTISATDEFGTSAEDSFRLTVNAKPTLSISDIPDQTVGPRKAIYAIPFTVTYPGVAASDLGIMAASSNKQLLGADGILLGGRGSNRTITLTPRPNTSGQSVITVTATAPDQSQISDEFVVTVNGQIDRFEPNDTLKQAYHLGVVGNRTENGLSIHSSEDSDIFQIIAASTGNLDVEIQFEHASGDLGLRLLTADGTVISESRTNDDNEQVSINVIADQRYFIVVFPEEGASNPNYDLIINGPPILADPFEPNNQFAQAVPINGQPDFQGGDWTNQSLTLHRTATAINDEDWFVWQAPGRGTFAVDAFFLDAIGDLELEIYNEDSVIFASSNTIGNDEGVALPVLEGQRYFIRVYGFADSTQAGYQLVTRLLPEQPRIYAAHQREIRVYDYQLQQLSTIEVDDALLHATGRITDVEIGPLGRLYASFAAAPDSGGTARIVEFTPTGLLTRTFDMPEDGAMGDVQSPSGFDVLEDGSFLIAQPNIGRVIRFSTAGNIEETFATTARSQPLDATITSFGELVTTDFNNDGEVFINATTDGGYWVGASLAGQARRYSSAGELIASRELPLASDAQEATDGTLFVSSPDGTISRFSEGGELLNQIDVPGLPLGLAVTSAERPASVPSGLLDRDGDAIPDLWETEGIDINGDNIIDLDLPAMGADPLKKDVFVEVDGMVDRVPRPTGIIPVDIPASLATHTILDRVVKAFADAPVPNPSGETGINLHLVMDDLDIPRVSFSGEMPWTDFEMIKQVYFGTANERTHPNAQNILEAKRHVFRYGMFADTRGNNGVSGLAEVPGNDFMITLGDWPRPDGDLGGTAQQQAGVFMHELGHTLGLEHGGGDASNYKPNYYSVMNYHWQVPNANEGWRLDYSHSELPALDENELAEHEGIGFGTDGPEMIFVGPVPFVPVEARGAVDWNRDGDADDVVSANVNGINHDSNGDGVVDGKDLLVGELLHGFNDWLNLVYDFTGQQNFADGIHKCDNPQVQDRECIDNTILDHTALYDESIQPDFFEDNDVFEDATMIADEDFDEEDLSIHDSDDVDWFELVSNVAGQLLINLLFRADIGVDLGVELYESQGEGAPTKISDAQAGTGNRQIVRNISSDTSYFVKVFPGPVSPPYDQGFYSLEVNVPHVEVVDGSHWHGDAVGNNQGADVVEDAGTAGDAVSWTDQDNWTIEGTADSGTPPTDDHVTFFPAPTVDIVNLQANRTVRSMTFLDDYTIDGTVGEHELTVNAGEIVVAPFTTATINADVNTGLDLLLSNDGTLVMNGTVGDTFVENGQLRGTGTILDLLEVDLKASVSAGVPGGASDAIGTISVDGDLIVLGTVIAEVNTAGTGRIDVSDNLELEIFTLDGPVETGVLTISARENLKSIVGVNSETTQTVLTASNILGEFVEVRGIDEASEDITNHAGFGVFVQTVNAAPTQIDVTLYQADPGDTDGNGAFNQFDIINLLQGGKYRTGQPASWVEGDFSGDGLFNQFDIVKALSEGNYLGGNAALQARSVSPIGDSSLISRNLHKTVADEHGKTAVALKPSPVDQIMSRLRRRADLSDGLAFAELRSPRRHSVIQDEQTLHVGPLERLDGHGHDQFHLRDRSDVASVRRRLVGIFGTTHASWTTNVRDSAEVANGPGVKTPDDRG